MKRTIFAMLVTVVFLFGCDDDSATEPGGDSNYVFIFSGLEEAIQAPAGSIREGNFSILVRNSDGSVAAGVGVSLSISGGASTVTPDQANTDANGNIEATYRVTIPEADGSVRILASVANSSAYGTIRYQSSFPPYSISLLVDMDERIVAEGENAIISVTAVVVDIDGRGVPNTKLQFGLSPLGNLETHFGSIVGDPVTDNSGHATAIFNSEAEFGSQLIKCNIAEMGYEESITGEIPITVISLTDEVRSFTISATPDFINSDLDPGEIVKVSIAVQDFSSQGIAGLKVELEMDYGTYPELPLTNEFGQINFDVIITRDNIPEGQESALEVVMTAKIPGTAWQAQTSITVLPMSNDRGSLTIETNRLFIWADGPGLSMAEITVILKGADGQSLANKEIVFTSNFANSVLQSPIRTDSSGRATTYFDDNRVPSLNEQGEPDSVTITARYTEDNIWSSLKIIIREQNPVNRIDLFVSARQMRANSGDSSAMRATCFLADGSPAPAGTRVIFDTNNGTFTEPVAFVQGNAGQAFTYYLAGVIVGQARLIAMYQEVQDTVLSNTVFVDLISGPPSYISVQAYPYELITSDPTAFSTIIATVTDTSGNPVRQGTYVSFATSMGTITPSGITDEDGEVTGLLRPGVETGIAEITVTCQGRTGIAHVTFIAGRPSSISLDADPQNIQVRGGGGITTSRLRATVRDPNGNLLSTPTTVVFEIIEELDPPVGCSFGANGQTFMSRTSNGVAVATINSGTAVGGKLIRAYTWRDSLNDPNDIVDVVYSRLSVLSGPPMSVSISMDDRGERIGGGVWAVDVSARVTDAFDNPVADRIPVSFSIDPNVATIENAFTVGGVALTRLLYESESTFAELEITATIRAEHEDIVGARVTVLPLQDGNLELNVDPANWIFEAGRRDAEIRCWVVLTDGYGTEINNAPILYTTNRAQFGWKDVNDELHMFFPDPARKFTGLNDNWNREEDGQATVFLIAEEGDIFLDPFTLEVTVQVSAGVEGYDDVFARPEHIAFTRHAE